MEKITQTSDEARVAFCKTRGINPAQHCCLDMAWFISEPIEWESQGPNPVIVWNSSWNEYRIDISHRGRTSTLIRYCPWCAKRLPESRRDEWFKALHALGYDDPTEQDIPEEYESDR